MNKLNGVYFKWIQDEPNGIMFDDKRHVGVIAQEVMAVLPEVVMDIHDGKYMGVDYASMMPLLIEALRELNDMLEQGIQSDVSKHTAERDLAVELHASANALLAEIHSASAVEDSIEAGILNMEESLSQRLEALERLVFPERFTTSTSANTSSVNQMEQ